MNETQERPVEMFWMGDKFDEEARAIFAVGYNEWHIRLPNKRKADEILSVLRDVYNIGRENAKQAICSAATEAVRQWRSL